MIVKSQLHPDDIVHGQPLYKRKPLFAHGSFTFYSDGVYAAWLTDPDYPQWKTARADYWKVINGKVCCKDRGMSVAAINGNTITFARSDLWCPCSEEIQLAHQAYLNSIILAEQT